MSVTTYGLASGQWAAQPNFRASRDANGKWTATQSYRMLKSTWEQGVKNSFLRDTPITNLFTDLELYWRFLKLREKEVERAPGHQVEVFCTFGGIDPDDEDDRELTFILNGVLIERSMLEHPLMRDEIAAAEIDIIAQAMQGIWIRDPDNSANRYTEVNAIHVPRDDTVRGLTLLSNQTATKWWVLIIDEGNHTWKSPTLQWTVESANLGGLQDVDIEALGLVDKPPGPPPRLGPPQPFNGKFEWLKISVNDVISTGSSSNSQTWELSPPGGFPRFKDSNGNPTQLGPYNYDRAKLNEA